MIHPNDFRWDVNFKFVEAPVDKGQRIASFNSKKPVKLWHHCRDVSLEVLSVISQLEIQLR